MEQWYTDLTQQAFVCFYKNIYNDDIIVINVLKEGNVFLTMHSTYFIYGYMALDIW